MGFNYMNWGLPLEETLKASFVMLLRSREGMQVQTRFKMHLKHFIIRHKSSKRLKRAGRTDI